jgi:ATP-dependent helicase/nuclease subunit B
MDLLRGDDAGRQVLKALAIDRGSGSGGSHDEEPMSLDEFAGWVDSALEEGVFVPDSPRDAPVVVTPLERAMLRPLAAVVPALRRREAARREYVVTIAARRGARCRQWAFPTAAERRDAEALAFVQLAAQREGVAAAPRR